MGYTFALELAKSGLPLETALREHLAHNHYPPLPLVLVRTAKQVIEQFQEGNYEVQIDLPEGITWKGEAKAPLLACIEAWHLDAFIEPDEDE